MGICHECIDAKDNYYAQLKQGANTEFPCAPHGDDGDDDNLGDDGALNSVEFVDILMTKELGKRTLGRLWQIEIMQHILTTLGWSKEDPDLVLEGIWVHTIAPEVSRTGSEWQSEILNMRAEALEKKRASMLGEDPSKFPSDKKADVEVNVVDVVDKTYMEKTWKNPEWSRVIDNVVLEFTLNEEQERGFRVIANHATSSCGGQLKMYLGGMAGTGKSQVLRALASYFAARDESHHFIIVAPTGSAAALLGGSTYHYMFGINNHFELSPNQLARLVSRLCGINYIFFDEISMVSCRDLYRIHHRLIQIQENAHMPFGGFNMIFSGDFAQLPPAIGGESVALYTRTAGLNHTTARDQEMALGKALWHQITTIVILQQNMRQKNQMQRDAKFRMALENMRYKRCTPEDIAFLCSRVSSSLPGRPCIADEEFRDVAIITANNVRYASDIVDQA